MPESYSVAQYVEDVRQIHRTGAATPETALYPPVSRLFNAVGEELKPKVLFVTQLKNQGAGMPDGGFYAQPKRSASNVASSLARDSDFGAVEIKPARWNLDVLTQDEQSSRYRKRYRAHLRVSLVIVLAEKSLSKGMLRMRVNPATSALTDAPLWFLNSYECDGCGAKWTDEWSCECNDQCPVCRLEIEPTESLDVVPDTPAKMELAIRHAQEQIAFDDRHEH